MSDRPGPLRVLFVVPDLRTGGAERHLVTLVPGMDRSRFVTSVVCIGEEGELFPTLTAAGVDAVALHLRKRQAARALVRLVAEMRRRRPDVVVVRGYNAEGLGRVAAVLAGVPASVVWVHNNTDIAPRSRFRRWSDRLLEPFTSAYFGAAHAQVPYLTEVLGHPAGKVKVIHNGVDPVRFHPATSGRDAALAAELGIRAGDAVVGVVAVLRPEKDHTSLLHAMRLVVDRVPQARLLVVGDGPLRTELAKLTAELGLGDHVVFAGDRPDVPDVLRLVDVVALTSTTECFPLAVLEAMASGTPTVCTAVGGIPEMVDEGRTGHLVPVGDAGAIADRLAGLLEDPDRAVALGRAAAARVRSEFTLDRAVRASERALEETAGRYGSDPATAQAVVPPTPIRLCVVLDLLAVGGAETLLLNLFRALDPAVVLPRVVCLRAEGPMAEEFRDAGFCVDVLPRSGRYDLRSIPRLVALLRADATDVVLVNHHHRAALTLGRVAARLGRIPANVVAAHDMDLVQLGKRCLPRHDVETLFLSDALVLLADSQGRYLRDAEGVGRSRRSRIPQYVIPNGIPIPPEPQAADRAAAREAMGLGPDVVAVGIVARLSEQKAHHLLIQAIARLAPAHAGLRLVVIGDGQRRAELEALTARLGISDRVDFLGLRADVTALLPGLDVSCLSSLHEGAPMVIIESMAAGVPVVTSDCGAVASMITDGVEGHLVPVGDVPALAAALDRLVSDPALRAAQGAAGRVRAERDFRIQMTALRYERMFTSLVPRRSA